LSQNKLHKNNILDSGMKLATKGLAMLAGKFMKRIETE
jgi:hypothetical protein